MFNEESQPDGPQRVAEQNSCDTGGQVSIGINFSAFEVRKTSVSALH